VARDAVRRAATGEFVRCHVENYGRAAGEETIVVDFSLLPVRDRHGGIVFLLAEGRDITEMKRAEAEISRKNEELQQLLDTVRRLDAMKREFFANVSHELRTPLALILGPAEAMLAGAEPLSERRHHDLVVIHRNAATLLKHVNDLLDLEKVDAGKLSELRQEPLDALGETGSHGNHRLHRRARAAQVRVVVAVDERLVVHHRMQHGEEDVTDAERALQLGEHRHHRVGGAGGVRDDALLRREAVVIDAEDDREIDVLRAVAGEGEQHAPAARIEKALELGTARIAPRTFEEDVDPDRAPVDLFRRQRMADADLVAVDHQAVPARFDTPGKHPVG